MQMQAHGVTDAPRGKREAMLAMHDIPLVASRFSSVLLSLAIMAAAQEPVPVQPLTTRDAGPIIAPDIRTTFKVKYVAQGSVYLDGGRGAGLAEGMTLTVKRIATQATQSGSGEASGNWIVAQLQVVSLADSSSVCEVTSSTSEIKAGDTAYLSPGDAAALAQNRGLSSTRAYPQVVTFTDGADPLEQEARDDVPRPPSPAVNRARGRIGVDYSAITSHGAIASQSSQLGLIARMDMTRIGGTYWTLSGYWRGRLTSRNDIGQQTLQDLINRTYHLSLSYDSPNSRWAIGVGRLYVPWANSLDTLDGGYIGRRFSHGVTTGIFAGTTPDPTSWSYNPDQRIAGAFVNLEGGSYASVRYTSTAGAAVSALQWTANRPFVFFENGIFYKRYISVYHSLQADDPRPAGGIAKPGAGIGRSYLTVRFQPHARISFDVNHNYFRDVPTFDARLIGTGLLDKYLFQGMSAGVRVEPIQHVTLYTDLGTSNRSGDARRSLNYLYGVTLGQIWKTGLRADFRYSKFNSSFADGNYRSISLSRTFGEWFRGEVQAGRQSVFSELSSQTSSRFLNSSLDVYLGRHYFVQGGYTIERGSLDYDQWFMSLGYRFDSKGKSK